MSRRRIPGNKLSRASTPSQKADVRQAFIDAGRTLLSEDPSIDVSMRQVAAEAGYSPGSIYQYFENHQALLFAIREIDLQAAADHFHAIAKATNDPVERIRKLAKGTTKYWLAHPDQFDVLFTRASRLTKHQPDDALTSFGQSLVVAHTLKIYYSSVESLFATLGKRTSSSRLAADTLIAATYGIISFARGAQTMQWSNINRMTNSAIDAIVDSWL